MAYQTQARTGQKHKLEICKEIPRIDKMRLTWDNIKKIRGWKVCLK